MLGTSDDLGLYTTMGNIVDYVAWGADAGTDDDRAALLGFWTNGAYIDTSSLNENETIRRDMDSLDTNAKSDWENASTNEADPYGVNATHGTPGLQNIDYIIPEFTTLALPIALVAVVILLVNKFNNSRSNYNSNPKKKKIRNEKKR